MRVGINGMGRIGRLALRAALGGVFRESDDPRAGNRLDVVYVNELKGGAAATAHLLEFDSVHGRWRERIAAEDDCALTVGDRRVGFSAKASPAEVPWGDLGCDIVGKAKASKTFKELIAKSRVVNLLADARIFMFGSRDVWFVVGLPVFLYAQGWHFVGVATFLAAWTIGYGGVQALAPAVVRRSPDGLSREVPEARLWAAALAAIPAALGILLATQSVGRPDLVVAAGLAVFGFAFAVNSSLHSY